MTSLSLYEDLLAPGEELELAAGGRMIYVASGEIAGLHAGRAAFGAWVEPAELGGAGQFVRVVLVRPEDANGDALAQGTVHV